MPAEPAIPLRDELLARYGDRLLLLEVWSEPSRAGGTVVAVLDRADDAERGALAAALRRHFDAAAPLPAVEILDRASFAAVERLVEAGLLELTTAGRRLLHRSAALQGATGDERRRRLEQAREILDQAQRKVRMAAVLASGGFPVEALAPLREGVETSLRSLLWIAPADANSSPDALHEVPMSWLEARDDGNGLDAAAIELVARLRGGPETLLSVGEDEARSLIAGGQQLAGRIAESLEQALSRMD